jgi:hypothetical protein
MDICEDQGSEKVRPLYRKQRRQVLARNSASELVELQATVNTRRRLPRANSHTLDAYAFSSVQKNAMTERRFILRDSRIREHVVSYVSKAPTQPPTEVTVRPYVEKRSLEANSRLWALHSLAGEFVGCSADDMHEEMLCRIYGYSEVKMPSGYIKRKPLKRSSQRNKKEFREFMDQVEAFYISELGVYLDMEPQ